MGRLYSNYLQDCIEWGGEPISYEEFTKELEAEAQEREGK